jgi:hypothetical protein
LKPIIDNLWKIIEKNMQPVRWVSSWLCLPPPINFLPSARQKAFGKDLFADRFFAKRSLPSAKKPLPSAPGRHSAKKVNPVAKHIY